MPNPAQETESNVEQTPAAVQPATPEYLTRADAQAMIADAVSAALAAAKAPEAPEASVERSDTQPQDKTLEALQILTRSVEALTTSVSAVNDRVGGLESTTIVRSDSADTPTTTETKKRDVFAGMLSRGTNE